MIETIQSDANMIGKMNTYSKKTYKRITTAMNDLKKEGFEPCHNPEYMKKGNEYAHYLRNCGKIIFEIVTE